MSFVFSSLHLNKLSNDIIPTTKQPVDDVLLSFFSPKAKTEAYELNSNFKNKSEWTLFH